MTTPPLRGSSLRTSLRAWSTVLLAGCLAGCAGPGDARRAKEPPFTPGNVYRPADTLPVTLKRVAVLPVTLESGHWMEETGVEALEPVLRSELAKVEAFEAVFVTPAQLRQWTGRAVIKAGDPLPAGLYAAIEEHTGCEGLLFAHLRPFHPYKPIVIGWQLKLVEFRTPRVLWAADQLFDAADPAVLTGAERYWRQQSAGTGYPGDAQAILNSPRRFGQFTLASLLATLPSR